ncbi:MAG: hypothetical protein LUQ04_02125 [Methanoregula sp.]|nr:hypothetical protein [Methanoregula sp.]
MNDKGTLTDTLPLIFHAFTKARFWWFHQGEHDNTTDCCKRKYSLIAMCSDECAGRNAARTGPGW